MMRELRDFVNNYGFFNNDHDNEKLWGPLMNKQYNFLKILLHLPVFAISDSHVRAR